MTCRQRDESTGSAVEGRIGGDQKRADRVLDHCCEGALEIGVSGSIEKEQFPSERTRAGLGVSYVGRRVWILRIREQAYGSGRGYRLVQQLQSLRYQLADK